VKSIVLVLCTLVLTACGGGGGSGTGTVAPPVVSSAKSVVMSVALGPIFTMQVADLNNDGLDDVVVSGWTRGSLTNYVYILLQNANGTLTDKTSSLIANNVIPGASHIIINDFDHDGHVDIFLSGYSEDAVTANQHGVNSVMFWGGATFTRQDWTDINLAVGACIADFNNDGHMDLLVSGGGFTPQNDVGGIYLNNGNRTFTRQSAGILVDNGFSACAVVKNGTSSIVYLGVDTYTAPPQDRIVTLDTNLNITNQVVIPANGQYYTVDTVAVDLDNDGLVDFVDIQNYNAGASDGAGPKVFYKNNGDGTFTSTATLITAISSTYSRAITINNLPGIFFAGSVANSQVFKGTTQVYNANFTLMAANTPAQDVAEIYQNTTTGKIYMLELLNGTFYTEEIQ
jgi:hypothetical protein